MAMGSRERLSAGSSRVCIDETPSVPTIWRAPGLLHSAGKCTHILQEPNDPVYDFHPSTVSPSPMELTMHFLCIPSLNPFTSAPVTGQSPGAPVSFAAHTPLSPADRSSWGASHESDSQKDLVKPLEN